MVTRLSRVIIGRINVCATLVGVFLAATSFCQGLQVSNLSSLAKLTPGSQQQVKITLFNDRDVSEQVDFNVVDYGCNSLGESFFEEEATVVYPRSSRSWITLGRDRVTLEPGESRDVYYVIEVPKDEELKGSYWAVVLIEPVESVPFTPPADGGFALHIKMRYAHHSIVNIGEGDINLRITKREIRELDGTSYLCLHVANQGSQFFDPTLTIKLYDDEGKLEYLVSAPAERLYPGNSQCFFANLQEIPKKRLTEKLTGFLLFDGGDNNLIIDRFSYP